MSSKRRLIWRILRIDFASGQVILIVDGDGKTMLSLRFCIAGLQGSVWSQNIDNRKYTDSLMGVPKHEEERGVACKIEKQHQESGLQTNLLVDWEVNGVLSPKLY